MKTTMTLSANMNCSMFDILNQHVDDVILIINFYLELGEQETAQEKTDIKTPIKPVAKGQKRIRVNDATATGGWF